MFSSLLAYRVCYGDTDTLPSAESFAVGRQKYDRKLLPLLPLIVGARRGTAHDCWGCIPPAVLRPEAVQAALEHETLAVPAKAKRFPSYRGWLELKVASHCDAQAS